MRIEARQEVMARVSTHDPLKTYLVIDDVEAFAKSQVGDALEQAGPSSKRCLR